MMSYYVWENQNSPEGHKARVHLSTCGHCNSGKGKNPNAGIADEMRGWSRPYANLQEALQAAWETGGKVSACKHCLPNTKIDL